MTGECEIYGAPLGAHNITRLCAECKLVAAVGPPNNPRVEKYVEDADGQPNGP
jgi:hypothetical protein